MYTTYTRDQTFANCIIPLANVSKNASTGTKNIFIIDINIRIINIRKSSVPCWFGYDIYMIVIHKKFQIGV